jgi:hypothetical protein
MSRQLGVAAVAVLVLAATASSAQIDLNNQTIMRQNPINSPLPPPPAPPLAVPGAVVPNVSQPATPRLRAVPYVRVPREVKRSRTAHKGATHKRAAQKQDQQADTAKTDTAKPKEPASSNGIPSICRGC